MKIPLETTRLIFIFLFGIKNPSWKATGFFNFFLPKTNGWCTPFLLPLSIFLFTQIGKFLSDDLKDRVIIQCAGVDVWLKCMKIDALIVMRLVSK